jgi:non-ribosomal peptide synthetase component F
MNIERLMALEKDIRNSGGPGCQYHADQLASLIAELGQEVGAVAWTKDAEAYGNALNEAAWKFVEECPEKSALLFNNTKKPLRAAILTYAEHVARATSPAHTSVARDADVQAMDVLSLAELVDAAVCLESCEAAWCGDEMELAAPRRRLAKAYSGLRKTLFIAQDALECALRNSKRGSRTNAACSTALEYLCRATKQSDDAAMRQEAE